MHKISALPTDQVQAYRNGAPDGYGNPPEQAISNGAVNPCRHCLTYIPKDKEMLVLAHRPFSKTRPFAETEPIYLCAEPCQRYQASAELPEVLTDSSNYLIKGYGADDRIVYGTAIITPLLQLQVFSDTVDGYSDIAQRHRSATSKDQRHRSTTLKLEATSQSAKHHSQHKKT